MLATNRNSIGIGMVSAVSGRWRKGLFRPGAGIPRISTWTTATMTALCVSEEGRGAPPPRAAPAGPLARLAGRRARPGGLMALGGAESE